MDANAFKGSINLKKPSVLSSSWNLNHSIANSKGEEQVYGTRI